MKLAFEKELRKAEKIIRVSSNKEAAELQTQLDVQKKQISLLEEKHLNQIKELQSVIADLDNDNQVLRDTNSRIDDEFERVKEQLTKEQMRSDL